MGESLAQVFGGMIMCDAGNGKKASLSFGNITRTRRDVSKSTFCF